MKSILNNMIVRLLLAVFIGIVLGTVVNEPVLKVILAVKQICGQIIFFLIPLIIIGFVASSITSIGKNASRLLGFSFILAYVSSIGAAFGGAWLSYNVLPLLDIHPVVNTVQHSLPQLFFSLEIPQVMNVMTALFLSVFVGLGVVWIRSKEIAQLLNQFRNIVLLLVSRVLMPLLPIFIAANFCVISYQESVSELKIFLPVILIIVICHYIWLLILYLSAALYSGKNSWHVLKYYAPAYFTALGTMSSAATLGVALKCANKSPLLDKDIADFAVPLFANIHLCGSILTEVFFVSVVSQLLYGHLIDFQTLSLFIILLGLFAIAAPGVPGGTVLASLGIVFSILKFDDAGTALLITIFALQDSFGTACNVTGDGALTLIVNTFARRQGNIPQ